MFVGIDISKKKIDVCLAHPDQSPKKWPVHTISLEQPDWYLQLNSLVQNSLVVLEPTGYHLSRPIVEVLHAASNQIYQTANKNTGKIREMHISGTKTDAMDARALALIAQSIGEGQEMRGTYLYDSRREAASTQLRLLCNERTRLIKAKTRLTNQLHALAHGVWPILSQKLSTYLNCVTVGYVTPLQLNGIHQRFTNGEIVEGLSDGRINRYIVKLVEQVPLIDCDDITRRVIFQTNEMRNHTMAEMVHVEQQIEELIFSDPFAEVTKRWLTIPAASPQMIAPLHVASRGLVLQMDREEFKAALGVHPKIRESGDAKKTSNAKSGYRPALIAIWMWTQNMVNPNNRSNSIRDYYQAATIDRAFFAARRKFGGILWGVARDPRGYVYDK